MMRVLRGLLALLFAVSLGCYALFYVHHVQTVDSVAPEITCGTDELSVSVDATDAELLAGMTARDDRDGDVTASLVVVSKSKFVQTGTLKVNYAAFDSAGNVATYTRQVTYTDYRSPHFALSGPLRFSTSDYGNSLSGLLSAEDCLDGDLTRQIRYTFNDYNLGYGYEGKSSITFQVTNSAGDRAELELVADVLNETDYQRPYPLLSQYLVYTKVGQELDLEEYPYGVYAGRMEYYFEDYVEEADYDGVTRDYHMRELVTYTGEVDYTTPGVYTVTYTLSAREEQAGHRYPQGSVQLYVVVEE